MSITIPSIKIPLTRFGGSYKPEGEPDENGMYDCITVKMGSDSSDDESIPSPSPKLPKPLDTDMFNMSVSKAIRATRTKEFVADEEAYYDGFDPVKEAYVIPLSRFQPEVLKSRPSQEGLLSFQSLGRMREEHSPFVTFGMIEELYDSGVAGRKAIEDLYFSLRPPALEGKRKRQGALRQETINRLQAFGLIPENAIQPTALMKKEFLAMVHVTEQGKKIILTAPKSTSLRFQPSRKDKAWSLT